MLILSRDIRPESSVICIGDNIRITVTKVSGNRVRLGIEAPKEIAVVRGELVPVPVEEAK
jgi:carbon storage regulator